ncbi:MAG: lysylphosphatidylglycerol synthase transmembrane domain-containing protein [Candidatus Acidiferrales bacterium]
MAGKSRKYFLLVVAVAVAGFIFFEFRHSSAMKRFDWGAVAASLRHANLALLLLSLVAIYVCYAIRALRWMQFSRTLGRTNFWNMFSATIMGFACNFLLGRPAEPIRPILIAKKDSLPVAGMFGVYFLERISDIAATVVLAGVALVLFQGRGLVNDQNAHLLAFARSTGKALLLGLVVVIALLVYFRYHGARWLATRLQEPKWRTGWREKIVVVVEGFSEGLQGIRGWSDLALLVVYTALHWLLVAFIYLWIAHAFGGQLASLDFAGALLVLAFTMVGSVAQLPGVGGGAQASSILVFTLIFGVEQEAAVTVSIVTWLITFAGCCLVGVPLMFREGWSMGELRRMVKEQERAGEATLLADAERQPAARKERTR